MKRIIVTAVLVIVLGVYFIKSNYVNNVCKTFEDYYTDRDSNQNCYYNPDYKLTVPEIAHRHSYRAEKHNVTTADGYILTLFRILPHTGENNKGPVFLQHGFGGNSNGFINLGKRSFALLLLENGYEVWLGNFRGTSYSRKHLYLNDSSSEYWEFSLHEYGTYDTPAQLERVYNVTQNKIIYVGFSVGSSSMCIFGSTKPELAEKYVKLFIALAPAIFLQDDQNTLSYLFPLWKIVRSTVQFLTDGKLYARYMYELSILKYLCFPYPIQMKVCQLPDMIVFGYSYNQSDPETLPISHLHNADWISVKGISHFVQIFESGNFQHYDYGNETNVQMYGLETPPSYNLSNFKIPTHVIVAKNDAVITRSNTEKFHRLLPVEARKYDIYTVPNEEFTHIDFVQGKDAWSLVYNYVIDFIKSH